jgi:hypothetical protein|nr:MAG TPA: hypothetical protein [Herelleviridae sp.]
MSNYAIMQIPIRAKNPCDFPEGSLVKNIYSGKIYVITKHFKNGMCNMYRPDIRSNENWNACNNAHFISADYISLAIRSLL